MSTNGTAIKGGCVTWRSHPASSPGTLAEQLSRWQDRYGVLFAVMVQILLGAGAIAVQGYYVTGYLSRWMNLGKGTIAVSRYMFDRR